MATITKQANSLTTAEAKTLAKCEATIERGRATFLDVGRALATIRDGKLYRDTHGTFEAYVSDKWDFEKRQAYRLIQAAKVCDQLDTRPANEAQARELGKLPADEQASAWQETVDRKGGVEHVTAADVRETVRSHQEPDEEDYADAEAEIDDDQDEEEAEPETEPNVPPPSCIMDIFHAVQGVRAQWSDLDGETFHCYGLAALEKIKAAK